MASQIEIVNSALVLAGEDAITSIDDQLKRAQVAKNLWPLIRDQVLVDHPWNCAMERTSLAADATAPAWGYSQRYQLPGDCLRIWQFKDDITYKREGRFILTNTSAPLYLLYIKKVTDTSLFDPPLADAIAVKMASRMIFVLQKNASAAAAINDLYKDVLSQAKSIDAQEGTPDDPNDDVFLRARV